MKEKKRFPRTNYWNTSILAIVFPWLEVGTKPYIKKKCNLWILKFELANGSRSINGWKKVTKCRMPIVMNGPDTLPKWIESMPWMDRSYNARLNEIALEKKGDKEPLESCKLSYSKRFKAMQRILGQQTIYICNEVAFKWNTEAKMIDITARSVDSAYVPNAIQMSLSII